MCVLPDLGLFWELERWLLNILKPFCNTAGWKLGFVFVQETTVSLHFWQFWWWNLAAGKCEDLSSLCRLCRQVWPGAGVSGEPRSLCSGRKSSVFHCSEQFQDVLWASEILLLLQTFPDFNPYRTRGYTGAGRSRDNCLGHGLRWVSGQMSQQTFWNKSWSRLKIRTKWTQPPNPLSDC